MSDKRFYQMPPQLLDPKDIGHRLVIGGMLFYGGDRMVIITTPDVNLVSAIENSIEFHEFTAEEWASALAASDDPQFYDQIGKAWHRKARYVISGVVQQKVWARDGFSCQFCGRKMGNVQLTIDHWIPLELGGANDTTNYITACRRCNKEKGDMHPRDYCRKKGLDYQTLGQIASSQP